VRHKVTFHPQAWLNDNAIDVDPQGDTVFHVSADHLEQYDSDQLKYELEPYRGLPQLPEWIRNWSGPFWFEVEEPQLITLEQEDVGAYRYAKWNIQNPHLMYDADPDKSWYATNDDGEALGPFDTLDEVRQYLTRYASINQWRTQVSSSLREQGRADLADEIAGISDPEAMVSRDMDDDPRDAAKCIIRQAAPASTQ